MKNFFCTVFFFASALIFAQCNIAGKNTLSVGEEETLSFTGATAQCTECHLWIPVGNSMTLKSDPKLNTVKVSAASTGRKVISLAVLTSTGFVQCAKNIDVVEQTPGIANPSAPLSTTSVPPPAPPAGKPCDIKVNNYKEVKYEAGVVSFFPLDTQGDWKYNWTVTYSDGETSKSYEKVPQFNYSVAKPIKTVKLQVVSINCMKEFTKTYDANYWTYF